MSNQTPPALAVALAREYAALPQVEAVALAGSQTSGFTEQTSDLDLYVYVCEDIPLDARAAIATARADRAEINNQFWEPGEEWIERASGIGIDVMFRHVNWIEEQLDRVLLHHQAAVGYSTCFWHNVRSSHVLYDRNGWFHRLHQKAQQPYPDQLRRAIIAKNHPILRQTISSYLHQLAKAVARRDPIAINHRVAALLASYFDIVFAVNRLPHPGEKRLLQIAAQQCAKLPPNMVEQVPALIRSVAGKENVVEQAHALIDGLDDLLRREGLLSKER